MTPYQLLDEAEKNRSRKRAQRWYEANRERVKSRHAERREAIREVRREWVKNNQEHVRTTRLAIKMSDLSAWKEREKGYRKKYKAQRAMAQNVRRARQVQAKGHHSETQWLARVIFYGWRCCYCGATLNRDTVTRDHMIPFSRGGSDWPSNLVPCCRLCNARKRHRTFTEYVRVKE